MYLADTPAMQDCLPLWDNVQHGHKQNTAACNDDHIHVHVHVHHAYKYTYMTLYMYIVRMYMSHGNTKLQKC